jgi:1,2-diacylglycerol 3-beta-galactosyltransferase
MVPVTEIGGEIQSKMMDRRRADFLFFDAGGGHRSAAEALRSVIERQQRPFDVELVNLQEILDSIDVFRKVTKVRLQDLYNLMLKKGWTLGAAQMMVGMQVVIRTLHSRTVALLEGMWRERRPDLVVSLIPHFNRALRQSLERALPGVPFVMIITDLADYPPHMWMEAQDEHVICGSEKAVEQAFAIGHPSDNIHRVSGMILNPKFYDIDPMTPAARAAARRQLGFDPDAPVGMVLFGGQGASVMERIARRIPDRQLLMICGRNARLAAKLKAIPGRKAPMFVEGFTKEVPRYMQLSDYFIGKPGPGSVSEAAAMHLPIIVECNAWTLPQERFNAQWVREEGLGIVLKNFNKIDDAVNRLLQPGAYTNFRAATERIKNRAVFEIPDILQRLMA